MQAEHSQETQHDQPLLHWTPTLRSRLDDCLEAEKLIAQIQNGQTNLSLLLNFNATTHLLAEYFELDHRAPLGDLRHTIKLCVKNRIQATLN